MKPSTIEICISKFNKFKIEKKNKTAIFQACKPSNINNKAKIVKNLLKNQYISKKIVNKKKNA